jgi:phosphate transport system protein
MAQRKKFTGQLQLLKEELETMGVLIQSAIANAVQILKGGDMSLLEESIKYEEEINMLEKDIENLCLKIMWQQHPVANDLRLVSSTLKIITDMERIGDNALDIADTAKHYYGKEISFDSDIIIKMATESIKMVENSVTAFINMDVETAREVIEYDDVVDDLFDEFLEKSAESFEKKHTSITSQMELLMIAKYFEKIADYAVSIAEWAEFAVTGEHERH